jgi:hypothetical protein
LVGDEAGLRRGGFSGDDQTVLTADGRVRTLPDASSRRPPEFDGAPDSLAHVTHLLASTGSVAMRPATPVYQGR